MSLYSTLCELSGSATRNGNGNTPSGSSDNGYMAAPYAWEAPESFEVTEETTISWHASPYNPSDVGIIPRARNEVDSAIEIERQLPPSFSYPGPVAGAGFLGLFAPAPGSPEYNAYVAKQNEKEKEDFNPEHIGLPRLDSNRYSTVDEVGKQVQGPTLWEKFSGAVKEGAIIVPEGENVLDAMGNAWNAATGVVKPSNTINLMLIGGAILLVILIIK